MFILVLILVSVFLRECIYEESSTQTEKLSDRETKVEQRAKTGRPKTNLKGYVKSAKKWYHSLMVLWPYNVITYMTWGIFFDIYINFTGLLHNKIMTPS